MTKKIKIRIVAVKNKNNKTKTGLRPVLLAITVGLISAGLFCSSVYVSAYVTPGTIDPGCTPGSSGCTVAPPLTDGFTGNFSGTGNISTTGTGGIASLNVDANGSIHNLSNSAKYYFGSTNQASISFDGNNFVVDPGGSVVNTLTIGTTAANNSLYSLKFNTSTNPGTIKYTGSSKTFSFTNDDGNIITVPELQIKNSNGVVYTFPTVAPTSNGQVLTANTNGTAIWTTPGTTDLSSYLTAASASSTYQPIGSYLTGITHDQVTTALGFTPLATNGDGSSLGGVLHSSDLSGYLTSVAASSTFQPALGFTPANSATTINGHALSSNVTITASDIGAVATGSSPTFANITDVGLTPGEVTFAGTGGLLSNSSNLTFDATAGLQVATTGNSQILSNSGTLILGGTGHTNNENLSFDFETTPNTVAISTGTGVTTLNFSGLMGVFTGGVQTSYSPNLTGAPSSLANGQVAVAHMTDGSDLLYYGSNNSVKSAAENGSIIIPGNETTDAISGDKIKVGDLVVGMIDKTMGDGSNPNSALHGSWVKLSSINGGLGTVGSGAVSGVDTTTLLGQVTGALTSLGISVSNGVTNISQLAVQKSTTDVARINKMEMVDSATGDIYCTWIENGVWEKEKGDCGSIAEAQTQAQTTQPSITIPGDQANQIVSQASQLVQQATQAVGALQGSAQQAQTSAETAQQAAQQAQNAAETAQQAAQQIQGQQSSSLNISSVSHINAINVAYGTALSSLSLPINLDVIMSDNSTQNLGIVWDGGTPAYDGSTSGTYLFSGVFTLTNGVTNTSNMKALVNVTVAAQQTSMNNSAPAGVATGDLSQNAAASLSSALSKLIKNIFKGF